MRHAMAFAAVSLLILMGSSACKSSQAEGVKTNYLQQWTTVAANVEKTTNAAKAVLQDEGLKDVSATSTSVDGKATGKKADGTLVTVSVKKKTESTSEATCKIGTMGDPDLGAEIVKKVKTRAEG